MTIFGPPLSRILSKFNMYWLVFYVICTRPSGSCHTNCAYVRATVQIINCTHASCSCNIKSTLIRATCSRYKNALVLRAHILQNPYNVLPSGLYMVMSFCTRPAGSHKQVTHYRCACYVFTNALYVHSCVFRSKQIFFSKLLSVSGQTANQFRCLTSPIIPLTH